MKTIITGSRTLTSDKHVRDIRKILDNYKKRITEVVCPYLLGASKIGENWATDNNIVLMYFPTIGNLPGSGFKKNKDMVLYADNALIFMEPGDRKQSDNLIKCLTDAKKNYKVFICGG